MPEDFEKDNIASGEEMPETPEGMDAAIEEETVVLSEQMEELEDNLRSVDYQAFRDEDFGRAYDSFKQAAEDINRVAAASLVCASSLIALGSMQMAVLGDKFEQVQGFFEGGLAAGSVAAAVLAIGHTINKMKGWSAGGTR